MDTFNNAISPNNLDLNRWIEFSLGNQDEISKQIALEELSITGIPPYLMPKLREMSAQDDSPICRQLAAWVIAQESAKTEIKKQMRKFEFSIENVRTFFSESDKTACSILWQFIRKAPSKEIISEWREALLSKKLETNRLIAIGLTILGKFGNATDAERATQYLSCSDLDVICCALTLLQQQNLGLFKKVIKIGLTSKSLKIQLHSVHLLKFLDTDESIKYIESFLRHKNALIRQKALREMLLIPFEMVEHIFLQYIGRETQPLLLVKAGFTAAFNPNKEFPIKLYDILLLSSGYKKEILEMVLRQTVEAIHESGILSIPTDEYVKELKQKLNLRRSEMIIRHSVRDLASKDENVRQLAIERLIPFIDFPSVKNVLKKHVKSEANEELKLTIESIIGESAQIKTLTKIDEFKTLDSKEQRKFLSSIKKPEQFSKQRMLLIEILNYTKSKGILLSVLRLFSRFGTLADAKHLKPFIKNTDSAIQASAIKAMGKVDVDQLLPMLNQFLTSKDARIKSSALEIYIKTDKESAIQYLGSMLRATSSATRKLGLSLLPLVDYPSIEPLVWNFIKYEADRELRTQAAYMIAANPTQQGLYHLYALSHNKNCEIKSGSTDIWNMAIMSAISTFGMKPEEIEESCKINYLNEHKKQEIDKSEYSYSSIMTNSDESDNDKTILEIVYVNFVEFKWLFITAVVLLIPLIWKLSTIENVTTSKAELKRRMKKINGSKFIGRNIDSNPRTQVGGPDWDGTLKSNAVKILSGSAYSKAISQGIQETKEFKKEIEQRRKQYLIDLYNNENEDPLTRMMAASKLEPNFVKGQEAFKSGDYSNAEYILQKVINNPQANSLAKAMAYQILAQMASKKRDGKSFVKWMDKMGKELNKISELKGFGGMKNFANTYTSLLKITSSVDSNSSAIRSSFKRSGLSNKDTDERIKALKQTSLSLNKAFR